MVQDPMDGAIYQRLVEQVRRQIHPRTGTSAALQRVINRVREEGIRVPDMVAIEETDVDDIDSYSNKAGAFTVDEKTGLPKITMNRTVVQDYRPNSGAKTLIHELEHAKQFEGQAYPEYAKAWYEDLATEYEDRPREVAARKAENAWANSTNLDRDQFEDQMLKRDWRTRNILDGHSEDMFEALKALLLAKVGKR